MQAKADADGQRARDDGELFKTHAHLRQANRERKNKPDIADAGANGIAQADIELRGGQIFFLQPALQHSRARHRSCEHDQRNQNRRQRNRDLAYFETEEGGAQIADHVVGFNAPWRQNQHRADQHQHQRCGSAQQDCELAQRTLTEPDAVARRPARRRLRRQS